MHQYASGSSLTFDWLDAILDKYTSYYEVPLKNPDWPALAEYVESRNAHFDELNSGNDAIWDRAAGTISYTANGDGSMFITGATGAGSQTENYGADTIAHVDLTANSTISMTAAPR